MRGKSLLLLPRYFFNQCQPKLGEHNRIPRAEVQEIARCVQAHLDAILPGCHCTLTGGYRRGKLESGDIDLIICPPAPGLDSGLLKSLRDRMTAAGIITHILRACARKTPGFLS